MAAPDKKTRAFMSRPPTFYWEHNLTWTGRGLDDQAVAAQPDAYYMF